jgi:AAA+ superfamily predicted ATPase
MATAEQLKSLIRSHFSDQSERFYTMALQVAAHEAKQGHAALAHDIREIVEAERRKNGPRVVSFPQDLKGLVLTEDPQIPKTALVIPATLQERIDEVILEYRQQAKLKSYGLSHRRKLLLIGPPGTGKTMTARVLAKELHLSLNTVQVDRLVTKFMGETSAKLRQIFNLIEQSHGVYLFDEFDAIGGERSMDNDVGEMRRVLNAFLQFIVLYYKNPGKEERERLIFNVLATFKGARFSREKILAGSEGLSHAEIDSACLDAIKKTILGDKSKVDTETLIKALRDRQTARKGLFGGD